MILYYIINISIVTNCRTEGWRVISTSTIPVAIDNDVLKSLGKCEPCGLRVVALFRLRLSAPSLSMSVASGRESLLLRKSSAYWTIINTYIYIYVWYVCKSAGRITLKVCLFDYR